MLSRIKCLFGYHKWFYARSFAKNYGWDGWYNIFDHESKDLKICRDCGLERHIERNMLINNL